MAAKPESMRSTLPGADSDDALKHIRELLRGLRFGQLTVVVQDGLVVQIDRTEKVRLTGNN